jgi:ubiquinone/menaquinone biosynthesis C-methylase UbiE
VVSKHNRRSRLFYNAICRLYDWLFLVRVYGYVNAARRLVDDLVEENDVVVDLGCGTGLVAHLAARRAKEVLGVDHARGMLRRAKRKGRHLINVQYVLADCRSLPLTGPFDSILSSFMLVILKEHERRQVVRDAYALLRPGGKLGLLGSHERVSHEWYTPSGWRSLLHNAGFEDVKILDLSDTFRIVSARRPSNT